MHHVRSVAVASIVVGSALAAVPARAADATTERARTLYAEAGAFERQGQWERAQDRLRSALQLRETPQLYYALGWALENGDKLLEARTEYETAARLGRGRPEAAEATSLAAARLSVLEHETPTLKVRASRASRITLDGREMKRDDGGATSQVNPGSHVVRMFRGSGVAERVVYLGRGVVEVVDLENAPTVVDVATVSPPPPRDNVIPWLVISGGIVLAAGGSALLVSAVADADARDSMQARWCTATACTGAAGAQPETAAATSYRQAAASAADNAHTKQAFGVALLGSGAIAAAVGTVLLLRSGSTSSEKASAPSRTRASASPLPGGAMAMTEFSF